MLGLHYKKFTIYETSLGKQLNKNLGLKSQIYKTNETRTRNVHFGTAT